MMPNDQRVTNFSADRGRFFSSPSDNRSIEDIRNEARYQYKIKLKMPNIEIQSNFLYMDINADGLLQYTFLDASGQEQRGQLDSQSLADQNLVTPLTTENLKPLAASILKTFEKREQIRFRFLADHHSLIEQEFQTLYAVLQRDRNDRRDFELYCYYCCFMLENYYSEGAYSVPTKAKYYHDKRRALEDQLNGVPRDEVGMASLWEKIRDGLYDLLKTPNHTTEMRNWLSYLNIYRILIVFSRLSVRQSLVLAQNLHWLDSLANLIGRQIDVDAMIRIINAPTGVFNALSVQIFALRFLIIVGEGLKHVLAPTEKESFLPWTDRLKKELYERHCDLLNDVTWGVVNLLSNYNALFNISAPVANWLTAGFLVFDVSLLFYRRFLASRDYNAKKAQFLLELADYQAKPESLERTQHINMLTDQLNQLDREWEVTSAYLLFNAAAALLLMGGFSISLLLASPAGVVASFVACTLAVAMYLSADAYKGYKEKSILLKQCLGEIVAAPEVGSQTTQQLSASQPIGDARDATKQALLHLIKTVVKNTVLPMLMVTLFAVHWPAALLITTLYVAYEALSAAKPKPPAAWVLADQQIEADNDAPSLLAFVS